MTALKETRIDDLRGFVFGLETVVYLSTSFLPMYVYLFHLHLVILNSFRPSKNYCNEFHSYSTFFKKKKKRYRVI